MVLVTVSGLAFAWFAVGTDTMACKAHVLQQKRLEQQRIQDLQPFIQPRAPARVAPTTPTPQAPAGTETGKQYQGIFDPGNLKDQVEGDSDVDSPAPAPQAPAPGDDESSKQYQGIFDPGNLKGQVEGEEPKD